MNDEGLNEQEVWPTHYEKKVAYRLVPSRKLSVQKVS
jgi:hypothetical protein